MNQRLYRLAVNLRSLSAGDRASFRLDRSRIEDALFPIRRAIGESGASASSVEAFVLATCARSEAYIASPVPIEEGRLLESFARLVDRPPSPSSSSSGDDVSREGTLLVPSAVSASGADAVQIEAGQQAVTRLFRIAAGLDSPLIGESEILGQLRYALARGTYSAEGSLLHSLGQRALSAGRAARQISGIRVDYVRAINRLTPAGEPGPRSVGVVGSGRFAAELARGFEGDGRRVTVFASHPERGKRVDVGRSTERQPIGDLSDRLGTLDLLVTAVRSAHPLLGPGEFTRRSRPLRIVDLGVPANIDPAVASSPGIDLVTLEALWRFPRDASEQAAAARAEEITRQGAEDFGRALHTRARLDRKQLVLAAHGAGDHSPLNHAVQDLAARVAHRLGRMSVETAFHLGEPHFAGLRGRDAAIVLPLLTSGGLFHRRLEEAASDGPRVLPPIGADPRVVAMVVSDLEERLRKGGIGADQLGIMVVGHGTNRAATSGDATCVLAAAIQEALPSARVEVAFLEQDPAIEDVARRLGEARPVLALVPFVLGAGRTRGDMDARLPEGSRWAIELPPLLEAPKLPQVVTSIACGQTRVLRLGTRSSPLALWQARRVATDLGVRGVPVTLVPMSTAGDRDLTRPLGTPDASGLFTDDLESLLLRGDIDIAVHSLKDLPLEQRPALDVAAILPRASAHEVLVSRSGLSLRDLQPGARVGTSSPRRRGQLLALRPDLCPEPLRGGVDARLQRVARGEIDAALLAAAGLERLGLLSRVSEHLSFGDFLPEAGQGALAVQIRRDDPTTARAVARLDHKATRLAANAERWAVLRLAQSLGAEAAPAIAALAVPIGKSIRLRLRLLDPAGAWRLDAVAEGERARDVAHRAADQLAELWRRQQVGDMAPGSRRIA